MDNFKLHFNKVPDEDKEFVYDVVNEEKKKWGEKIPGEYDKKEEELEAINVINDLIQQELKNLGINPRSEILPGRVHLINDSICEKLGIKSDGAYLLRNDAVFINKDIFTDRIDLYKNFLHEIIHYYSFGSMVAVGETKYAEDHRTGYVSFNSSENHHDHFRGFNEAVIEKTLQDVLQENKDYLVKKFNISEEEQENNKNTIPYYDKEIEILNIVINKLAKFYEKDELDIWNKIKKGLFSGEMMHLRDIEKVFGAGSLRVLAAADSNGTTKEMRDDNLFQKINNFFETDIQEERDKLANQILSERERLQFKRNKNIENKYVKS